MMVRLLDWNIEDVADSHQSRKNRRIRAIARILERKQQVNYTQFLAEMQFNGIRKSVAKEYLDALKDLKWIDIGDSITWIAENLQEEKG